MKFDYIVGNPPYADEGILEMCGCPSDVAKEYVETRDKEIQNKKKRK